MSSSQNNASSLNMVGSKEKARQDKIELGNDFLGLSFLGSDIYHTLLGGLLSEADRTKYFDKLGFASKLTYGPVGIGISGGYGYLTQGWYGVLKEGAIGYSSLLAGEFATGLAVAELGGISGGLVGAGVGFLTGYLGHGFWKNVLDPYNPVQSFQSGVPLSGYPNGEALYQRPNYTGGINENGTRWGLDGPGEHADWPPISPISYHSEIGPNTPLGGSRGSDGVRVPSPSIQPGGSTGSGGPSGTGSGPGGSTGSGGASGTGSSGGSSPGSSGSGGSSAGHGGSTGSGGGSSIGATGSASGGAGATGSASGGASIGGGVNTSGGPGSAPGSPYGPGSNGGMGGSSSGVGYSGYGGGDSPSEHGPGPGAGYGTAMVPVLLDLEGNGFDVNPLSSSHFFADLNGDSQQTRMAWAGNGTGVLVLDADGDGKISQDKEFVFTKWDATAKGDLEAIKNVFDTNHNGKLDAGDARFGEFKVWVNGSLVSLASLGITSIDLTPKGSVQTFEDGSAITGTTTYIKADGSTGFVGDAVLATETQSHVISQQTTTNADGSKTTTITGANVDGSTVFREEVTKSSDGQNISAKFDDDGNGTFDRSQTDRTVVNADGSRVQTVSDFNVDGSLAEKTITTTSANGRTVTTALDQDGDGKADEVQTYIRNADGSGATTTTEYSTSGALLAQVLVQASADGLSKTVRSDANGDGMFERVQDETTVLNPDGERIETISVAAANGALIERAVTRTSADGRTKTIETDHAGDGSFDQRSINSISVNTAGTVTSNSSIYNADGTLRSASTVVNSANGLSRNESIDLNGDGTTDLTSSDTKVVDAVGNRIETAEIRSGNGTLLSKSVTATSADQKSVTVTVDANGDGKVDLTSVKVTEANGNITQTQTAFDAAGGVDSRTIVTTAAGGFTEVTKIDSDGDEVFERTFNHTKIRIAGSAIEETESVFSANNSLLQKIVSTTSADGLTQNIKQDVNGDGAFESSATIVTKLNADGSRTETTTTSTGLGIVVSKAATTESADRKALTTTVDLNADGKIDQVIEYREAADGSETHTAKVLHTDGRIAEQVVTSVSASGLVARKTIDENGDGVVDFRTMDVTTLNANGSSTRTVSKFSGNDALLSRTEETVSGNHLSSVAKTDIDGNGTFDRTVTSTSTINVDGSFKTTIKETAGSSTLVAGSVKTTSDDGLTTKYELDRDGNGIADETTFDFTTMFSNGGTGRTTTVYAQNGQLLFRESATTSPDRMFNQSEVDLNGDGLNDIIRVFNRNQDGSTIESAVVLNATGRNTSSASVTTSDDGLSIVRTLDLDGRGNTFLTNSSVSSLNSDGSMTTINSSSKTVGASHVLLDRETVTVSGNGLTKTYLWDIDGNGVTNRSATGAVIVNADGSVVETNSFFKLGGSLESRDTVTTSADRLTETSVRDVDGDGIADYRSQKVAQADGYVTTTLTNLGADGVQIVGKTVISEDRDLSMTVDRYANGMALSSRTTVNSVVDATGKDTTTSENFNFVSNVAVLRDRVTETVSGNGLVETFQWDTDGLNGFDQSKTAVTTLGSDGSQSIVSSYYSGSSLTSKFTETTSANGLFRTTHWDKDGNGTFEQASTDVTTLLSNGEETRVITAYGVPGKWAPVIQENLSADGLRRTTLIDANGRGGFELTISENISKLADGSTVETTTTQGYAGNLESREVETISSDGRNVHVTRDSDGNGTIDQTVLSTQFVDGSAATLNTYFASATTSALNKSYAAGAKTGQTLEFASADGLTILSALDSDGNGTFDSKRIVTKVINADGSSSIATVDYIATFASIAVSTQKDLAALAQTLVNTPVSRALSSNTVNVSADGRTATTTYDFNGDGVVDRTVVKETEVNGATDIRVTNTAVGAAQGADPWSANSWLVKGQEPYERAYSATVTDSADGLTSTIRADMDGNGTQEYTAVTRVQIDGSRVTDFSGYTSPGFGSQGKLTISADGKTRVYEEYHSPSYFGLNGDILVTHERSDGTFEHVSIITDSTTKLFTGGTVQLFSATGVALGQPTQMSPEGLASTDVYETILDLLGSNLYGTATADTMNGTAKSDRMYGDAGNDILTAGAGNDLLFGETGDDTLFGGAGDDILLPGKGVTGDWQYLNGETGNDTYVIGKDVCEVFIDGVTEGANSGAADKIVFTDLTISDLTVATFNWAGTGIAAQGRGLQLSWSKDGHDGQVMIGQDGNYIERFEFSDGSTLSKIYLDTFGRPVFAGTAGDDNNVGRGGADWMIGGAGNDRIDAGAGSDSIQGDAGNDILTGGAGGDHFYFSGAFGNDQITDFQAGLGNDDRVYIGAGLAFDTFAEVMAATTQQGANTVINLGGGNVITLQDVLKTALVQEDIGFLA